MSIKINTRFGEVVTSQAINEKVNTLFGGNVIIEGFDVTKNTNTSICITPGKAIVCGASIEEDETTINLNIPSDLLSSKTLYAVIEYIHETRSVKYKIVTQISDNMVVLAEIIMTNSVIDIIKNSEKTLQLNELSKVARDLETGLLNTQYLEVSGEDITLTDGYRSKTEDMRLEGNTKQNLVLVPNKERVVSCEYSAGPNYSHNLKDTKSGCIDTVIQGNTVQNLVKATENKEVIPSGMLNLDGACNHKIDGSKAGFVDVSIKGKTIKNLINEVHPYSSAHISGDVCTMKSLESGYAITEIRLKHFLKASTKYTIFINVLETSNQKFSLDSFGMDFQWTSNLAKLSSVGLNKIVFTTPSETARLKIQMNGNPGNLVKFNINMLLVEGDWTSSEFDEIPCIDGIVGVGEKSKNLFTGYEPGSIDLTGTGGDVAGSTVFRSKYIEVKPNTKYTLSQERSICYYDTNKARITNNYCNSFITPNNCHYIRFQSATNEDMYMSEGEVAINEPYYEGHKIEILSNGKNLINLKDMPLGSLGDSGKVVMSPTSNYKVTPNFIKIEPTRKICFYYEYNENDTSTPEHNMIAYYDKNFSYIGAVYDLPPKGILKSPPAQACYLRLRVRKEAIKLSLIFESSIVYEPYVSDKTQILLDEPLHYLTPNVYDEVTVDGELIRNVGKIVFDGSENWRFNSNNDTNILFECLDLGLPTSSDAIISDKFESIQSLWNEIQRGSTQEGIDIGGAQGSRFIQISIKQSKLASASISAFSDWLKKNPVTVLYEAAEKEVIKIDTPRIATFDGITYMKTSSEVQPEIKIDSKGDKYPVLLKPDTKYTVRWFAKGGDTNLDLDLGGTKLSANKTASIVKVTTPATLVHENLYVAGWNTAVSDIAVIEDYKSISDTPYVTGIESVGDKSKNLLDENYLNGYVDDVTGEFVEHEDRTVTNFIEVEPSTQYILSKNGFAQQTNVLCYDKDKRFIKKNESLDQPFKTTEDCKFIRMYWDKSTIDNSHQVQLEKGTEITPYTPHYKGYGVKVKSCGKNLIDINTLQVKTFHVSSYKVSGSRIDFTTTNNYAGFWFDYSNLIPGKTYVVSYKGHNSRVFLVYDDNTYSHGPVTVKNGGFTQAVFKIGEHKKISALRCENGETGATSAWIDEIQIEEADSFSSYEAYKEDIKEYYLDEPLRRLPSGLCDEINADGELVRRVGKVVFDGSESGWSNDTNQDLDLTKFFNIKISNKGNSGGLQHICDRFKFIGNAMTAFGDIECFGSYTSDVSSINIRIFKSRLETKNVSGFKKWLSENPTTVYYQLTAPIITPLDMQVVLPNGVHDKVCDDGTVERRIRKITLNGSERIANGLELSNSIVFYIHDIIDNRLMNNTNLKCDRFDSDVIYNVDKEGVYSTVDGSNSNIIVIRILKQKLKTLDVEGFKKWLSENPTTVWYELATPYKEDYNVNVTRLNTYNGTTNVIANNLVKSKVKIDSEGEKYPAILKPGTKYTVSAAFSGNDDNVGINLGGAKLTISKSQNKAEITTPSGLSHSNLYLSGWNIKAKNVMVIEGESSEIYFQGIAGVGDKSKNIMSSNIEYGAIYPSDGLPVSDIRYDRKRTVDFIKVNPNKSYVFSTNIGESKVNWYAYDENKKYISFLGYNDKIVTPHNCYYIKYHNGLPENYDLSLVCDQIEEGTVNSDYTPYYSGHKVEIKNVGKNLAKHTSGYFENKESWCFLNGKIGAYLDYLMKSNTKFLLRKGKYIFNYSDSSCTIQLCVGNEEKIYGRKQIITLEKDAYCVFRVAANSDGIIQWSDLQLEKDTEITSFEPYKEYTNSIYLNEPLMKLPNGVCDEIIGDKLIRRVGKVVLDGDEQCNMHNYSNDNFGLFYIQPKDTGVKNNLCEVVCDRFPTYNKTAEHLQNENTEYTWKGYNSGRAFWFWIKADRLESVSVEGIKKWLSLNPVILYYELQSPIIIDLDTDLNLRTHDKVNNITTSCAVKPELSFKSANNLRAITRKVTERIIEAEKLVDELLLPNIVETDYERTLLEFDYEVSKFNLEGDE